MWDIDQLVWKEQNNCEEKTATHRNQKGIGIGIILVLKKIWKALNHSWSSNTYKWIYWIQKPAMVVEHKRGNKITAVIYSSHVNCYKTARNPQKHDSENPTKSIKYHCHIKMILASLKQLHKHSIKSRKDEKFQTSLLCVAAETWTLAKYRWAKQQSPGLEHISSSQLVEWWGMTTQEQNRSWNC